MESAAEGRHMVEADLANVLGESWFQRVRSGVPAVLGGTPDSARLRSQAGREVDRALGFGINVWNHAAPSLAVRGVPVPEHIIENLQGETARGDAKLFDLKRFMSEKLLTVFGPEKLTGDPVVAIIELGHFLTKFFGGIAIGAGAASGLAFPIALAGSFLSSVLPTLPFIFWVLAVTGYFLRVGEFLLTVNLWAIGNLRMDGEGIVGDGGRQGWFLVAALGFMPVLLVFGFLISMIIFKVTAVALNLGVYTMLESLNVGQSAAIWFFQVICVIGMITIAYAVLAERSFSMLYELPDRAMNWIGI